MPQLKLTIDDLTDLNDALETLLRISEAIEPERDNEKDARWRELHELVEEALLDLNDKSA